MNRRSDRITPRQLTAAAFVSVLSPLVRRYPRALAETAGRSAWLSPVLALVPLALCFLAFFLFYRRQPPGMGFADILCSVLGSGAGRALTGIYGLWFLAYAGFLLRSGADRFISTIYPGASPGLFVVFTALLCALAASGRTVSIARTAMLFRPLMAALFLLVFALTAAETDVSMLVPVTAGDLLPNCYGAVQTVNVLASCAFLVFFTDRIPEKLRVRSFFGWALAAAGLVLLMTVSCLGVFGPGLTAKMTYPFFMLVRDLSVLGSLERAEPVVIALWVLSDFVMISLLLQCAEKNFRFCLSGNGQPGRSALPVLLCAGAAVAGALCLPGDLDAFAFLSDTLIPLLHAGFALGLPAVILTVGLLRKRL